METAPPLRVLIVDDNEDAADSLATLLELYHYTVRVAYDGAAGLRAARECAPDCLISDINMPGLDGFALARAVRADPNLSGVKLLAMSAYSGDEHIRRVTEAGFDYRLTKASETHKLLEVLRMIEDIKSLALKTQSLAAQNADLAGQTKELLREVKADIKEVKQEVRELKNEVKELKAELDSGPPPADGTRPK